MFFPHALRRGLPALFLLATLAPLAAAQGGAAERFEIVGARSEVGFDGSSTLHDFTGRSHAVSGFLLFDPADTARGPQARIEVEAATLDTENKKRDRQMRGRLATDEHPLIVFELESFTPGAGSLAEGLSGTAQGTMEIHGTRQPLTVEIKLTQDGDELQLDGRGPLLITDYGIKPPRILGLIKMAPEVQIFFTLRAARTAAAD